MPIDYSKWDKLQFSDSDDDSEEEEKKKKPPPPPPPPPARPRTAQAGGGVKRAPTTTVPNNSGSGPSSSAASAAAAMGTAAAAGGTAATPPNWRVGEAVDLNAGGSGSGRSEIQHLTGDFEGLSYVHPTTDTYNGSAVPAGGALVINDPSKIVHTEDGRLIIGDLDGEHIVLERGSMPGAGLAQQLSGNGETCYHGSTRGDFEGELQERVTEYTGWMEADSAAMDRREAMSTQKYLTKLGLKYPRLFMGNQPGPIAFARHAFASAASEYLNCPHDSDSEEKWKSRGRVLAGLTLALSFHYVQGPASQGMEVSESTPYGKSGLKYSDLVNTGGETGIIRVLAKHLPCDCFKRLKASTLIGDKAACCEGCQRDFLVGKLKHCASCHKVSYCSKECQQSDWPFHKTWCPKRK